MKSPKQSEEITNVDLLKKEIETLKKKLKLKDEQCQINEELISEHEAVLEELNKFKEEYREYKKKTNECKKKYEQEIDKFKKTIKELKEKWNDDYKDKCISNMNKNADLEIEQQQLQKQIKRSVQKISSLEEELEKEKKLNQETEDSNRKERLKLEKRISELELENSKLKASFSENVEDLDALNQKDLDALNRENQDLKGKFKSIEEENRHLKEQLDSFQNSNNNSFRNSSKSPEIDESFSLKKLETDSRFIKYYNNREKRLLMIENSLKKDKDEARKLYIIEQIQEKLISDEIKEKIKKQEEQIENLNELNECYNDIHAKIEEINKQNKIGQNPLIDEIEKVKKENISLKEDLEAQKYAYSKFTKAAFKVFSVYKSGFEEISQMLQNYQSSYQELIDDVEDVSLRINFQHPLISFYKKLSHFALFSQD